MTLHNPVPGLTRDLPSPHEAPDHVRGGVSAIMVKPTRTPPHTRLNFLTPNPVRAWVLP